MIYKLKELRIAKNMTQDELASAAGISRQTLSKIESGEEVEVKVTTLESLGKALGCSVADFLCN